LAIQAVFEKQEFPSSSDEEADVEIYTYGSKGVSDINV